jgi:hypothetical protein
LNVNSEEETGFFQSSLVNGGRLEEGSKIKNYEYGGTSSLLIIKMVPSGSFDRILFKA